MAERRTRREPRTGRASTRRAGTSGAVGSRLGPAGAAVTAAGVAVNALGYVVPVLGARQLPPAELGALASVLAIGAIAAVPALGLQTALAVKAAQHARVSHSWRVTVITAAVTATALAAVTPFIAVGLRLSPVLALLIAATSVAVIAASQWLGQLQGAQRFHLLAAGMVLLAVARYGGVIAGLAAGAGVVGSVALGAAVSWLVLPAVGAIAWRGRPPDAGAAGHEEPQEGLLRGRDVAAASGATLALLAVSYADLIIARHLLPADEAGAYAVGSVLTKGALWAPQVVTVLALPRLAQGSQRAMRAALGVVASSGAVLVLAALLAGEFAVRLAGGAAYAGLGRFAAGFAFVGALYALVFVLVNAEIAAGLRWPAVPLWAAIAGLALAASFLPAPAVGSVLAVSLITATTTTSVMAMLAIRRVRRS